MKKLIVFMILSSIFLLFASTTTSTSTTFEFQAQKKRPSSGVNDDWKFSINIVDRFHNDGDVLTGLPDIGIAKNNLVSEQNGNLTSKNLYLFDVIYTTNSFFYPMQIDITFSEFVNTDNSEDTISITPSIDNYSHEFIVTSGSNSPSDFAGEYENLDILQNVIQNGNTYSLKAEIPFSSGERWDQFFGFPYESFKVIKIDGRGDQDSYADIKYTFPVSIRLDDPNSLENKSGTYVMTVKVEAKTDL